MKRPYVIAINAISGGGKTALTKLLATSLPKAVLFSFDDLDDAHVYPKDFYEWMKRGSHLSEFDCRGIAEAVESEINQGTAEFIILDYPFGRDHPQFQSQIDLSVFIDTPLDIALARRILRGQTTESAISAEKKLEQLEDDLIHYIDKARYVYLDACRCKDSSDLVLDGCATLDRLKDQILEQIALKKR